MPPLPDKHTIGPSIVLECRDDGSVFSVTESHSYCRFPAEVRDDPTLSLGARMTYSMLVGFAIDSNRVYPGQQLLADRLGVTPRSVRTYIDELRVANLLRVERRGLTKTNVYILAVWVGNGPVPDRKHASGQERKQRSGLERKHTADNNQESDNQEVYNQETHSVRAKKAAPSERDLVKAVATELRKSAQRAKIDALCAVAGISPASLSQRTIVDWTDTFATSPLPLEHVSSLTAYLLSQPWYGQHRERLNAKALVRTWPGWFASGCPQRQQAATSLPLGRISDTGAQRDAAMQELAQQIANERGEVFNGVAPSYWTNGGSE